MARFFQALCKLLYIKSLKTASYRPQTNRVAELRNKLILKVLRAKCHDKANWPDLLPVITAAQNFSVSLSLGQSPHFCLFGVLPRWACDVNLLKVDEGTPEKQWEVAIKFAERLQKMR